MRQLVDTMEMGRKEGDAASILPDSGKIVYMVKEDIQLLDENSGKLYWKEEDDYDATPIIPPNNKYLHMLEKDEIRVYRLAE